MGLHEGTVTVSTSGKTRLDALARACAHVHDATGEQAHIEFSGRAPHWRLDDSRCEVVVMQTADGGELVAGVDVSATFRWRES